MRQERRSGRTSNNVHLCPQGSLSASTARLTAILTAALTAALDLPVRSVRCRRRLWSVRRSGVVQQMSHDGSVAEPYDRELYDVDFGHEFWTPAGCLVAAAAAV